MMNPFEYQKRVPAFYPARMARRSDHLVDLDAKREKMQKRAMRALATTRDGGAKT